MQLVERHIRVGDKAVEEICFRTARLYNFCNYYKRQSCFGSVEKFGEYELSKLLAEYNQDEYRALPIQTSQQTIKLLFKNWKAYFESRKAYRLTPSSFLGRPRIPKYLNKKGYAVAIFTSQQIRLKGGYIYFPKQTGLTPLKTKADNVFQVRITPQATCFIIEVVYEHQIQINNEIKKENFLALDLGLNNLVTSINNVGLTPFIINGRVLKSVNQVFNKSKAELMSYIGNKGTSNRIKQVTFYRNNFIENKIHKISRFIINYCIENKIGSIIVGKNKGWKDGINIGNKNNQNFVNIPHAKLIKKISYKAKMVGIEVIETEESYTSKIDHLAFEEMCKQEKYLGKRLKRGLFQSSIGKLINADVNGAIGIARKVFGDSVLRQIIDSGLAYNPIKINIA